MRLPLAAVVAGAVAISNTIPSRRIAQFLMSLAGHTIPDEEGRHWQARLEGQDVVRLECQPGRPDYFEIRVPLTAFDTFGMGGESTLTPDGGMTLTPDPSPCKQGEGESGLQFDKAFLLAGLVGSYRMKLEEAGIWTPEDSALLDGWVESLTPEEKLGVFLEEGEPSPLAPLPASKERGAETPDSSPLETERGGSDAGT